MRQMPIYKQEKDAGIADIILATASSPMVAIARAVNVDKDKQEKLLTLPAIQNFVKATNQNQIDLFYMNDIMVSVGWNDNQDVFLAEEVWAARNTPADKPFNFEHSPREIIGHITDQFAIAANGDVIPDDTLIDDLPEQFDILNNTVIYRFYNDAEYKEKIDKIIEEISTSEKWKVSMEALFDDFDYALEDGNDTVVITRTKDTAYLSQYLVAYDKKNVHKGKYKGKKIGRVLKNITFCGKGLTDNPANPKSLIKSTEPFIVKADKKNASILNSEYTNLNEGESKMNEQEFKLKVAELEAALATASSALKDKANSVKELETSLAKANENLTSVAAKVADLEKTGNEAKASLEVKTSELKDISDKFAKASERLNTIDVEVRKNSRISVMTEDLKMSKESASEIYETLASLNDEQFKAYAEKSKKLLDKPATPVTAETVLENVEASKVEAPVVPTNENVNAGKGKIKDYLKASKGTAKQGDK